MLADEYILSFISLSAIIGQTKFYLAFVVNFNFSFSTGLQCRTGRYKISAQQKALAVSGQADKPSALKSLNQNIPKITCKEKLKVFLPFIFLYFLYRL
jgi:hypothetical protein